MIRRPAQTLILLVLAIGLVGCSTLMADRTRRAASGEPTPTPIPTAIVPTNPTYVVQRGNVIKQLEFTGRVAPVEEKELFFRRSGRVRQLLVKQNQDVQAGQLLADLEMDDLERELTSAKLQEERARVRLEAAQSKLDQQIRRAEINVQIAQLNLESARAQNPAPRKALAEAELEKARIALERAQAEYDGIAWRNDRAATPQAAALQQATLSFTQAQANYDLAMQAINDYRFRIAILERQVELAKLSVEELKDGLDPLLLNDLAVAEATVKKIEAQISDAQIVAPFDGRVLSVALTEGRNANAFDPVIVVGDLSRLEVKADIGGSDAALLAVGMAANMTLLSRPGEVLTGSIRRLPYSTELSSGVKVADTDKSTRLSFDNPEKITKLELGDLLRVKVLLESKDDVLWLPPQAIRSFEGRRFVVIQDGAGQRRVDVKIGIEGPERVEIMEGVQEGQVIIGP